MVHLQSEYVSGVRSSHFQFIRNQQTQAYGQQADGEKALTNSEYFTAFMISKFSISMKNILNTFQNPLSPLHLRNILPVDSFPLADVSQAVVMLARACWSVCEYCKHLRPEVGLLGLS